MEDRTTRKGIPFGQQPGRRREMRTVLDDMPKRRIIWRWNFSLAFTKTLQELRDDGDKKPSKATDGKRSLLLHAYIAFVLALFGLL